MILISNAARKTAALALSAVLAGAVLTASSGAQAFTPRMPRVPMGKMVAMGAGAMAMKGAQMGKQQGARLVRRGLGFGAAALAGGLALGAMMPSLAPECAIEERPAVDEFGNTYYVRVRVCE